MRVLTTLSATLLLSIASHAAAQPAQLWPPAADAFEGGWTFTPAFSPDGRSAYVVHWEKPLTLSEPQRLYRFDRSPENPESWSDPVPLDPAPGRLLDWPHVSADGARLFLSVATQKRFGGRRIDDFDLYTTKRPVGSAPLQPVPGVNRAKTPANATRGVAANEFGARMTRDGALWFWSQRPEGPGGRDIFAAVPDRQGGYENVRSFSLNTPGRESHPWIARNGRWMIFTSDHAGGLGGDDLWLVRKTTSSEETQQHPADAWGTPCPLPPPINSAYDDEAAGIDPVTGTLFFTSKRPLPSDQSGADKETYRVYRAALPEEFCQ